MGIEFVDLALVGGAHGAAGAVHHGGLVEGLLRAQLGEFAVARRENALQRAAAVAIVGGALIKAVEIAAAPEIALEFVGADARVAQGEPLAEYPVPRHERDERQQGHDELDHQACIDDQFDDG